MLDIASPLGAMLRKLVIFTGEEYVHMVTLFYFASPLVSDVEKIDHFQAGKHVHMVPFFPKR